MTTLRRLKYDSGKLAIYDVTDGSINDNPLTDPLNNVSRLHFHSDLEYPAVIATYSGTVTLSALSADSSQDVTHTIAAHGRAGIPYVEGRILVDGIWVPLAGSVPVASQSGNPNAPSFARFLHLGANASNIILSEYSISNRSVAYGSTSYSYVIFLTDKLVA